MSGTTLFLDSDAVVEPSLTNGFFPPYADNLVGYYEMDPSLISDGRLPNLVNPSLPALIVGTPVWEADGATFEGMVSFLDAQLPETIAWTYGAVAKPVVASGTALPKAAIIGNYSNPGSMMYFEAPSGGQTVGSLREIAFVDNGSGGATSAAAAINEPTGALNWSSVWGRVGAASRSIANLTTGQEATVSEARARVLLNNTLRIGSSRNATYNGRVKIARAAIYSAALSDANRLTMHQFWKSDVADLGITV